MQSAVVEKTTGGPVLEERSPCFGWKSYWANTLLTEIVLLLFPGAIILTVYWPRWGEGMPAFLAAVLLVLPVALLCAWSQNGHLRRNAPCVTCQGGVLNVVVNSELHYVPLDRCRWYRGHTTRATMPDLGHIPTVATPALLIEFPHEHHTKGKNMDGKLVPTGPVILAVGFDDESDAAWQEALRGSGARHDLNRESMPSPLSSFSLTLIAFVAVPTLVLVVGKAARAVDGGLMALGIAQDIVRAVTGPLLVLGFLILLLYAFLFLLLHWRRCCVTREQAEATMEPFKHYRLWLLILLVWGGIPSLRGLGTDLIAPLVGLATCLVMTGLAGWHFHFLLKKPWTEPPD